MSIWDEFRHAENRWKPEEKGDEIAGTIVSIRVRQWDDGGRSPELLLRADTGEEVSVTANQVQLQRKLAERAPNVGDWVKITYLGLEKLQGGKTLKHFDVDHTPGAAGTRPPTSELV